METITLIKKILNIKLSFLETTWAINEKKFESNTFEVAQKNNISIILSELLLKREVKNIKSFLSSKLKDNISFNEIEKLENINSSLKFFEEIKNLKKVGIFSDYDVDGACSAAILKKYLSQFDIKVEVYIPNRITEGYGPNKKAIQKLLEKNKHVIFLDCGSNSIIEQDIITKNKSKLLIIDHHECDQINQNVILINPKSKLDKSNFNDLCTTALVFLVVFYLTRKEIFSNNDVFQYLDLVALATICDLVPLNSINRSFVKQGLNILNYDIKNKGIVTLINQSKINQKISEYHLGFILGPRINAGGRMGESYLGFNLLSCENIHAATQYSSIITSKNQERQKIQNKIINSLTTLIEESDAINFFYDPSWHIGVIGIIAGRLMRGNKKPSFVMTNSNDLIVGSGRSTGGLNIGNLMIEAVEKKIIIKGGGHSKACGFTLEKDSIKEFKNFLFTKFQGFYPEKNNFYEMNLDISVINENLLNDLSLMSPFGQLNPEPVFKSENLKINILNIFKEKHIKCKLFDNLGNSLIGIFFDIDVIKFKEYISKKDTFNCFYKVKRDTYSSNVIAHIEDIH